VTSLPISSTGRRQPCSSNLSLADGKFCLAVAATDETVVIMAVMIPVRITYLLTYLLGTRLCMITIDCRPLLSVDVDSKNGVLSSVRIRVKSAIKSKTVSTAHLRRCLAICKSWNSMFNVQSMFLIVLLKSSPQVVLDQTTNFNFNELHETKFIHAKPNDQTFSPSSVFFCSLLLLCSN